MFWDENNTEISRHPIMRIRKTVFWGFITLLYAVLGLLACCYFNVSAFGIVQEEIKGVHKERYSLRNERPYTFTLNGRAFQPTIISMRDDPEHPAPGDLIEVNSVWLTLGPERECHFVLQPSKIAPDDVDYDRLYLQQPDGRRKIVGVRVTSPFLGGEEDHTKRSIFDSDENAADSAKDAKIAADDGISEKKAKSKAASEENDNPLEELSPEEIHGLWGVYFDAWSDACRRKMEHINPERLCVALSDGAMQQRGGKLQFPPLPKNLRYLVPFLALDDLDYFAGLTQLPELRYFWINAASGSVFNARWLKNNAKLCRLDIHCVIIHPEDLPACDSLETLDLSNAGNLMAIAFVEQMPNLRSLNLSGTTVEDSLNKLNKLFKLKKLKKLDISRTRVHELPYLGWSNQLESLLLDETMVRDLRPLSNYKSLKTVSAVKSMAETLPLRPMPSLRTMNLISSNVSQPEADAFVKTNPKCRVRLRWVDELRILTAGATRLRVCADNAESTSFFPQHPSEKKYWEITDPEKIREIVRLIEIDEKYDIKPDWMRPVEYEAAIDLEKKANGTIEFYRNGKLIASINYSSRGLYWSGHWSDRRVYLTKQSLFQAADYFTGLGHPELFGETRKIYLAQVAADKKLRKQLEIVASFFPKPAAKLFQRRFIGPEDETGFSSSDASVSEDDVVKAFDSCTDMLTAVCRTIGTLDAPINEHDPFVKYLLGMCRNMDYMSTMKVFDDIQENRDHQGELGAARLYFHGGGLRFFKRNGDDRHYILRFTPILLENGEGDSALEALCNEDTDIGAVQNMLREIARGQIGRDGVLADTALSIRPRAYLCLALHPSTNPFKPEMQALLRQTTRKADVAALNVALALLGEYGHIKPEYLAANSPIWKETLTAIQRFDGRDGLDILLSTGLESKNESLLRESQSCWRSITDQPWGNRDDQDFAEKAKHWLRDNGAKFVEERRKQKSAEEN
jgi:hypothetical protein